MINKSNIVDGRTRPVVVLGPLWECVVARLVGDWAHEFGAVRHQPLAVAGAAPALQRGTHLEPRLRRDKDHLDCIPLQAIRDLAEKVSHPPHYNTYIFITLKVTS